jgi:enoyl-CoA hydratase
VTQNSASTPDSARDYSQIEVKISERLAIIRLARPSKLNPLDWATIKELRRAIAEIEGDGSLTVAVITGSGRSFSAGGDLDGYVELYRRPEDFAEFLDDFSALLRAMENSPVIFVAAINGICVAGGLELLLACDLALAADSARIGDGHLNFGQLPGAGGSQRLPRVIGTLRAKHLIMTGILLSAEEARAMGLVNAVFPADTFERDVIEFVAGLLEKSRAGLRGAKHLVNLAADSDLETGLSGEIDYVHRYATSHPDAMEGLNSFREKRNPKFAV